VSDVTEEAIGLREFLQTRRARISPEEAGLGVATGRRGVPGLRREEVAELAGVSADLYTRLETGRAQPVSESVLDAIAHALRLSPIDRRVLLEVAGPVPGRRRAMRPQRVRPALLRVLETLPETPALLLGHRLDVLALNPVAGILFRGLDQLADRNLLRYLFLAGPARELYTDWPAVASGAVSLLHRYAERHPHDDQLTELAADLAREDRDFRRWWSTDDVLPRWHGSRQYHHPAAGLLTLDDEWLHPGGDPDQTLLLMTAESGTPSEHALRLLAGWAFDHRLAIESGSAGAERED
jgi:transcriptional regulator with XRE-family HTH domain